MGKLIETVIVEEPQARGFIETEAHELAETARKAVEGLTDLARSGKIGRSYLSMLFWFDYILDDMREKFLCSDNGWGDSYTTDHDLELLQREREQVEERLRQLDGLLAGGKNNQPAS